jgi:coatomer subunit delta
MFSDGSYPTVSSHSGDWSLDPNSHSLHWSIPIISGEDEESQTGSLMFTVGGDDVGVFYPVSVSFTAAGSLAGVGVASVVQTTGGDDVTFSVDSVLSVEEYNVV